MEITNPHALGFVIFANSSTVNIFWITRQLAVGKCGSGSINCSVWWVPFVYLFSFAGCFISYYVHRIYCISGAYTVFGGMELLLIATNMIFWYETDYKEWKCYKLSIE